MNIAYNKKNDDLVIEWQDYNLNGFVTRGGEVWLKRDSTGQITGISILRVKTLIKNTTKRRTGTQNSRGSL